jgi:hypothetical protein
MFNVTEIFKTGAEVSQQRDVFKNKLIFEKVQNVCIKFWRELEAEIYIYTWKLVMLNDHLKYRRFNK